MGTVTVNGHIYVGPQSPVVAAPAFVSSADAPVPAVTGASGGTQYYASTTGSSTGAGTIGSPWTLAVALSGGFPGGTVHPGDTINIRSGTYTGRFTCTLAGSAGNQIVVRPYPADGNQWDYPVKIDNGGGSLVTTLQVASSYTTYRDLELFCSVGNRKSSQDGSSPTDLNSGGGFGNSSGGGEFPGNKFINNCVHDTTDGLALFAECTNAYVYGNLVYNVGWDGATDRGHGHCFYCQQDLNTYPTSVRQVYQNLFVNGFNDELNIFGSGPRVGNIYVDQQICSSPAGPSAMASGARTLNWQTGGHSTDAGVLASITNSVFYIPDSMGAVGTPNYFLAYAGFDQAPFADFTLTNNWFYAYICSVGAQFTGVFGGPNSITGNIFLQSIGTDNASITTGNFPSNTYLTAKGSTTLTRLFANAHQAGRGHLAIANWGGTSTVAVDISSVVASGKTYEIRDASDYFGTPVLSGTYSGGTVNVPMTGLTCATPLGTNIPKTPSSTAPEFNAFVVIQTN